MLLKGRAGGGHDIFNFARALMAYDPSVYNYSGECDEAACEKAGAGLLIGFKVAGGCKTEERAARLAAALAEATCRVEELDMAENKLGWAALGPVVMVRLAHLTELKCVAVQEQQCSHHRLCVLPRSLPPEVVVAGPGAMVMARRSHPFLPGEPAACLATRSAPRAARRLPSR